MLVLLAALGIATASLPQALGFAAGGFAPSLHTKLPACSALSARLPAQGAAALRIGRYASALKMSQTNDRDRSEMFTEDTNGEISVTPLWEDTLDDLDGMNLSPEEARRLSKARSNLLRVTAGLERGSQASKDQRANVERAVADLERCLPYSPAIWPDCVQGSWRLIYSSALSPGSGSGGGASRTSPFVFQTPDAGMFPKTFGPLSPVEIGNVYQNIDLNTYELDNVVDVKLQVPFVNSFLPETSSVARVILRHSLTFEPDYARRLKIVLKECKASYADGPLKAMGSTVGNTLNLDPSVSKFLSPPELSAPVIQQISQMGPGIFDTSYCDDDIRIAKGDRGELRVFVRER